MTHEQIAYISNICPIWPIEKQRAVKPESVGREYVDELDAYQRRQKKAEHLTDRAMMLRTTTRNGGRTIWAADILCLAFNTGDFLSVCATARKRGYTIEAGSVTITPKTSLNHIQKVAEALETRRKKITKQEEGRAGAAAFAEKRKAESEAKAKANPITQDMWSNPAYTNTMLETRTGLSVNTLRRIYRKKWGSRKDAIAAWKRKERRNAKR